MLRSLEQDLLDASDALEDILKKLPDTSLAMQVDIAARLKGCAKNLCKIDDTVKDAIKKKLKEKPGTCNGELFKACLAYNDVTRFDQSAFKEAEPQTYEEFCNTKSEPRVTFEPR